MGNASGVALRAALRLGGKKNQNELALLAAVMFLSKASEKNVIYKEFPL